MFRNAFWIAVLIGLVCVAMPLCGCAQSQKQDAGIRQEPVVVAPAPANTSQDTAATGARSINNYNVYNGTNRDGGADETGDAMFESSALPLGGSAKAQASRVQVVYINATASPAGVQPSQSGVNTNAASNGASSPVGTTNAQADQKARIDPTIVVNLSDQAVSKIVEALRKLPTSQPSE